MQRTHLHPKLENIYAKSDHVVSKIVAGEAVLVPIRKNMAELDNIYRLNETAAFTWERIDGQRTLLTILLEILQQFEITEAQATQDLLELVVHLSEIETIYLVE